jgi:hypothetical protein
MDSDKVFEGSVEPKGDGAYYDHISGETKTGWKPSEIIQFPWMKTFFKYNKPSVKDYDANEKDIKKWIDYECPPHLRGSRTCLS